jgi:hypothetical protein
MRYSRFVLRLARGCPDRGSRLLADPNVNGCQRHAKDLAGQAIVPMCSPGCKRSAQRRGQWLAPRASAAAGNGECVARDVRGLV